MDWRRLASRVARKVDRACAWAIYLTCVGGSALLDLHDLLGH